MGDFAEDEIYSGMVQQVEQEFNELTNRRSPCPNCGSTRYYYDEDCPDCGFDDM